MPRVRVSSLPCVFVCVIPIWILHTALANTHTHTHIGLSSSAVVAVQARGKYS